MTEKTNYKPDFDAKRLPIWFYDNNGTIAYHLYPDCGYIDDHPEYELSKSFISCKSPDFETFDDWMSQVKNNRSMCKSCRLRYRQDYHKNIDWREYLK